MAKLVMTVDSDGEIEEKLKGKNKSKKIEPIVSAEDE
jgi:hypothetical protein